MRYLLCVLDSRTGSAEAAEMAAIDARGDDVSLRDGPAFDTAECTSGFWIIEAPGPMEAVGIAQAASRSCNRRVEMRPFLPPSPTPQ